MGASASQTGLSQQAAEPEVSALRASIPSAWTPGPWSICHNGDCPCKSVRCDDHPIAEVTNGEWGDEYPAIRPVDTGGMSGTAVEAYMARIVYGKISHDTAKANGRLIASAPTLFSALEYARNLIGPDEVIDTALALAVEGDLEREAKMQALYKQMFGRTASAIEARSDETRSGSAEGESAVPNGETPK
jgi:hypothetical protein